MCKDREWFDGREELDQDLIDDWARRAPGYTFVSLAQDIEMTVVTPTEVPGDD